MNIEKLTCPHCGAPLVVPDGARRAVCEYCDCMVAIDAPMSAEEKAYQYEKGRMRARAEYGEPVVPKQAQRQSQYTYIEKKKRHTFWWVMGWVFIFPIPATILIVRSKKMPWWAKALLILLVWGIYLAIGMSGSASAT